MSLDKKRQINSLASSGRFYAIGKGNLRKNRTDFYADLRAYQKPWKKWRCRKIRRSTQPWKTRNQYRCLLQCPSQRTVSKYTERFRKLYLKIWWSPGNHQSFRWIWLSIENPCKRHLFLQSLYCECDFKQSSHRAISQFYCFGRSEKID